MQSFLESLFLPPGINILLIIIAISIWKIGHRAAVISFVVGIGSLWVLSMPWIARNLIESIQYRPSLSNPMVDSEGAIVTLGTGIYIGAPEYEQIDTVSRGSLERIRYSKHLYDKVGLPILFSGGKPDFKHTPEAVTMNQVFIDEYQIAPRWLETESLATIENAKYSSQILKQEGVNSIFLVTHAFHMHRAKWSFEQFGINVTPAPMGYYHTHTEFSTKELLPSAKALYTSQQAIKEIIALLSYQLFYNN